MKIRSLLMIVAVLSVFLIGAGTAHAVLGVADDVAARSIVVPIICGVDASNGLNTLFAIADVSACDDLVDIPDDGKGPVVTMHATVRNYRSAAQMTFDWPWTCKDVEVFNCKDLVGSMNASQKAAMTKTIEGVNYYVGYVNFDENSPLVRERFISWVYLEDLLKGLANGFNGLSLEGGAGARLEEQAGAAPITALSLFPRYFILNSNPDTWNWWIVLAGRNQISCAAASFTRVLSGIICNEEENCPDFSIPLPDEVNIIDVETHLPGIHTGFPKAGFAKLSVQEAGDIVGTGAHVTITGTQDYTICGLTTGQYYSIFGWSYQRAQSDTVQASWDAIHPMHREYCNSPEGMNWVTGPACTINIITP